MLLRTFLHRRWNSAALLLLLCTLALSPRLMAGSDDGGAQKDAPADSTKKSPEHIPNLGFKIYDGEEGQFYMRFFTYARYLNQRDLEPTYTDYFGRVSKVKQRQDIQLNKFFLPFSGWFLDPSFRFYLYVWSSNVSQGDPAQVVGAGNVSYKFSDNFTFGGGITSLPSTRSTEGQFPYWLSVDSRHIADEFFRGSYTSGFWIKGEVVDRTGYMVMIANNLSTLGVSASQLDNVLNTLSLMFNWMPTTGEFGPFAAFGDFEGHENVATRFGVHYTTSTEDQQSQPGTDGIENSQVRLTDGTVIFTPEALGPGIDVNHVRYEMSTIDAAVKYAGLALEGEVYRRRLTDFAGTNTAGIGEIDDRGFQIQASGMAVPKILQIYVGESQILGFYGDGADLRVGLNYFPFRKRGVRVNLEWLRLHDCPVGYTAVPYPVGGNGDVFHANLEMNF